MKVKTVDIRENVLSDFVDTIRPQDEDVRKKVDIGYSWDGSIAILFEIRPRWNNPEEIQHLEFAKIRYFKSRSEWQLYWMRASGKWEVYEPYPVSSHLESLLEVIDRDRHCFFG